MNALNITHNPNNHVSQVSEEQSQHKISVVFFIHMLDFGFQNMVTVVYMPTVPGRDTLATWISCRFLHLQIETQITSSGALAYFRPILVYSN